MMSGREIPGPDVRGGNVGPADDRFVDAAMVGNLLFLGAQSPLAVAVPVLMQTRDVIESCVRLVEQAGGGVTDLVFLQVFLLDLSDEEAVHQEITRYDVQAACSFVQVPALPAKGARVQVNGIASLGTSKQRATYNDRTVAVRADDMIFVGAIDASRSALRLADRTILGQAAFIFGEICETFANLGAPRTSIGWLQLYLARIDERTVFTPTRFEILGEHRPAATLVEMPAVGLQDERMAIWAMGSGSTEPTYIDPGSLDERFRTHLSAAIKIDRLVLLSGQVALDDASLSAADGGRSQTIEVLALIREIVRKAGGQMSDIAWLNAYVTDVEVDRVVRREVATAFHPHRPAINIVACSNLVTPRHIVEINAVAVMADVGH